MPKHDTESEMETITIKFTNSKLITDRPSLCCHQIPLGNMEELTKQTKEENLVAMDTYIN